MEPYDRVDTDSSVLWTVRMYALKQDHMQWKHRDPFERSSGYNTLGRVAGNYSKQIPIISTRQDVEIHRKFSSTPQSTPCPVACCSCHDNQSCRSLGKHLDRTSALLFLCNPGNRTCNSVEFVSAKAPGWQLRHYYHHNQMASLSHSGLLQVD